MPWVVDHDKCTGCGLCTDTAPDVFRMDDNEEFAETFNADAGADHEDAKAAADDCPEQAIAWQD